MLISSLLELVLYKSFYRCHRYLHMWCSLDSWRCKYIESEDRHPVNVKIIWLDSFIDLTKLRATPLKELMFTGKTKSVESSWLWRICHFLRNITYMLAHRRPTHSELTAATAWWPHQDDLTNSSQQAQGELILWVHCELNKCPQNEETVSFNVSSLWISCELKFFT